MFGYTSIANTPQDSGIYQSYYMHAEWDSEAPFEQGYILLMKISRILGLNYLEFRLAIAVFGYLLLFIAIKRFKLVNTSLFYVYYIMMPFVEDPIQLRNFLMITIVLVSCSFLYKGADDKYSIVKYVVGIMLASSIQTLGLFFLLLIPFYLPKKINYRKTYVWFSIISTVVMLFPITRNFISVFLGQQFMKLGTIGMKISQFLMRAQPGKIMVWDGLVTVLLFVIVLQIKKQLKNTQNKNTRNILLLGEATVYMLIIVFPMYFFSYNFDRLIKDGLFILFVVFAFCIPLLAKINVKAWISVGLTAFTVVLFYSFNYYNYGDVSRWETLVYPVLFDNQFMSPYSEYR